MIRCFVAVTLPDEIRSALARVIGRLQNQLPAGRVRWVTPERLHLTLVFLGDTPPERLAAVQTSLAQVARRQAGFRLTVAGLGCFPHCRRPRVIWAGLAGDLAAARALKEALDAGLEPLGWTPDKRAYRPHVTLGRVRPGGPLPPWEPTIHLAPLSWPVDAIHLVESQLQPDGPHYAIRHSARLSG